MRITYLWIPTLTAHGARCHSLVGPGLADSTAPVCRKVVDQYEARAAFYALAGDGEGNPGVIFVEGFGKSANAAMQAFFNRLCDLRDRIMAEEHVVSFLIVSEASVPRTTYEEMKERTTFETIAGYEYGEREPNLCERGKRLATLYAFDFEMQTIGAERLESVGRSFEYILYTGAGRLRLSVDPKSDSIWSYCRFDEPDRAKGTGCNPYSGKWNASHGAFEWAPLTRPFRGIGLALARGGLLIDAEGQARERDAYERRMAVARRNVKPEWNAEYTEAEIAAVMADKAEAEAIRQSNITDAALHAQAIAA